MKHAIAMYAAGTMPSSSSAATERTHYDVLQISQTATSEEIKAAYRSLIIGCHPDKMPSILKNNWDHADACKGKEFLISERLSAIDIDDEGETNHESDNHHDKEGDISVECEVNQSMPNSEEEESQHTTAFHQIQTAYFCLRDSNKRRQYDESISRKEARNKWKWKGALEVNLSEMDCDWCCVIDEDNSDDEEEHIDDTDGDMPLQKVFFHPCRCGDMFQVVQEELLESINDTTSDSIVKIDTFTNRVWQCESCSLTIRIHVDVDID